MTFHDIVAAESRIRDLVRVTPLLSSRLFNERAGRSVFFKGENLQRGGSFKLRGAFNFIAQMTPEERKRGVVAFSSGNHAQAVAIAAAYAGVRATIVMPTDAPKAKVESTRAYNPEIVFYDRHRDDREQISRGIAERTGAITLPSYDHPWVIAGQGTIALEMLRECPELDAIAVPLGGGGLLSGTLTVARELKPAMRVYGVEPELANDWHQSLAAGKRICIPPSTTIADGLRTPSPGAVTFPIVQALDGVPILVTENEIRETVAFLLSRLKLLVEPSGAVAAAAALHRKFEGDGGVLGVVLSGGNVDLDSLADVVSYEVG